jgi:hypothetical protein
MQDLDRSGELISVIEVARQYGKHKSVIFKVLNRLAIETKKSRSTTNKGQVISYITMDDLRRVEEEMLSRAGSRNQTDDTDAAFSEDDLGVEGIFSLLLLEPNHDPGRFKVGFAVRLSERLRQLRCSAPFTTVVKTWPCKRLWEKTAIDCVSDGTERIHTEVFRTDSIDSVRAKCERFFDLMPTIDI